MNSAVTFALRKPFWKRRTFWFGSFYGRVLLFALASAGAGALSGVLIGTVNWMQGGSSHSWWYWASFTLFANALFMMIVGLLVALSFARVLRPGDGGGMPSVEAAFRFILSGA